MNRDDILRMALEAGFWGAEETAPPPATFNEQITIEEYSVGDKVEHFAALVAAAEREENARLKRENAIMRREVKDYMVNNFVETYGMEEVEAEAQAEKEITWLVLHSEGAE